MFRDIAYELALSDENRILPEDMSVANFWLDHTGRVRVLDHPLVSTGKVSNDQTETARQTAVAALLDLFDLYMIDHEHPVGLLDINDELRRRNDDPEIFDWLVNELNETIEKQSSWNQIDRAGMMAISLGIELSILSSFIFLVGVLFSWLDPLVQASIATFAGLGGICALAWFMDGGVAMRLTGVSVRNNDDKKPK